MQSLAYSNSQTPRLFNASTQEKQKREETENHLERREYKAALARIKKISSAQPAVKLAWLAPFRGVC